jgi:DNA polymerase-1
MGKMEATTRDAYNLFHEGTLMLSRMEHNGIRIDLDQLERSTEEVKGKIQTLQDRMISDEVYPIWKGKFGNKTNLGSRQQLAEVLFDEMGYQSLGRTARGRQRTDEKALERIDLPFVKDFLAVESHKKSLGTYLEGMKRELVGDMLHCSFDLNTAVTYRSSSKHINFQNLPVRDPEQAALIRPNFIPYYDYFAEVDFSTIEVRVGKCYHNDPVMDGYLRDKSKDMHRDTAMGLYLIDHWEDVPEKARKAVRYQGKNGYVFPVFYGSVYFQCAPNLWEAADKLIGPGGVPMKEHLRNKGITKLGMCDSKNKEPRPGTYEELVKKFEEDFWGRRFKVYAEWKKSWYKEYLQRGWFQNFTGFRFSGLMKYNDSVNYPIQSCAFHCLLWSLIRLQKWLDREKYKTRILGQIHDSVLLDIPERELDRVLNRCVEIMTEDLPRAWKWVNAPLEVEVEVPPRGESWHKKEKWICKNGYWSPEKKAA